MNKPPRIGEMVINKDLVLFNSGPVIRIDGNFVIVKNKKGEHRWHINKLERPSGTIARIPRKSNPFSY
jgi:hypothetical protein